MLPLGIALLLLAASLIVVRSAARVRTLQLERCQMLRDEFFASATAFVEDGRTPDLLVEVTDVLARTIADKHLTWLTFWRLAAGIHRKHDSAPQGVRAIDEVVMLPSDLLKLWRHLMKVFVLAITFNSFWIGPLVRRSLLRDGQRAQVVVQELVDHFTPQTA